MKSSRNWSHVIENLSRWIEGQEKACEINHFENYPLVLQGLTDEDAFENISNKKEERKVDVLKCIGQSIKQL